MGKYQPIPELGMVIAAAGGSCRFGTGNKLLASLNGIPLFVHCLNNYCDLVMPGQLSLVVPEPSIDEFRSAVVKHLGDQSLKIIPGGETRAHSVFNGLSSMPGSIEYVAIHDAARPLSSPELLIRVLETARKHGGAVAARPITDTVKREDGKGLVDETLDRSLLWSIETPQIFLFKELEAAYSEALAKEMELTDDAKVMELAGHPIALVDSQICNLKITFPDDLIIAESLLRDMP